MSLNHFINDKRRDIYLFNIMSYISSFTRLEKTELIVFTSDSEIIKKYLIAISLMISYFNLYEFKDYLLFKLYKTKLIIY